MLRNETQWEKKGDFNEETNFGRGTHLNRNVDFKNTNPASKIKEVSLLGYKDGDIRIRFDTDNESEFKLINKTLKENGFLYAGHADSCDKFYFTTIPNVEYLRAFLSTLAGVENSVNEIAPELIQAATPYSKEEPTIPGWVKTGSFSQTIDSGADLNRNEIYNSAAINPMVKELNLLGYYDGSRAVSITLSKKYSKKVTDALTENGFPEPDIISGDFFYKADIQNKEELARFLQAVSSVDSTVGVITPNVLQAYEKSPKESLSKPERFYYGSDRDALMGAILYARLLSAYAAQPRVSNSSAALFGGAADKNGGTEKKDKELSGGILIDDDAVEQSPSTERMMM